MNYLTAKKHILVSVTLVAVLALLAFATITHAEEYDFYPDSSSYDFYSDASYDFYPDESYDFYADSASYDFYPDSNAYDFYADSYDFYPDTYDFYPDTYDFYPDSYVYDYGYDVYGYDYYTPGYASYGYSSYSTPIAVTAPGYSASVTSIGRPTTIASPASTRTTSIASPVSYAHPTSIASPTTIAQPVNVSQSVNVAQVASIGQATPAATVQYVYPQSYSYSYPYSYGYSYPYNYNYGYNYGYSYPTYNYPTYQNVSCSITASPASITNGQTSFLNWTSYGASRAQLSDGLGYVATTGSLTVRPESSRMYTLTVWGYNGQSATCNTSVAVSGAAPYVSLSQIPYTGLDLGVVGSIVYWLALASVALAGAYLVVYYLPALYAQQAGKGGALAFATSLAGARSKMNEMLPARPLAFVAPAHVASSEPVKMADAVSRLATLENLAVLPHVKPTTDSMSIVRSSGNDAPRIVINRG
jgi:hypothetical protein